MQTTTQRAPIRERLRRLPRNRNFLLVSAIVLGLLLGDVARLTAQLTVPALVLAMTVSVTEVAASVFRSWRKVLRAALLGMALSYVANGLVLLLLGRLLVHDPTLWLGLVLLAATPCGVAVIPFSYILGGDIDFALVSSIAVYVSALLVMPLMGLAIIGSSFVQPARLLTILFQLIVVPLVAAQVIRRTRLRDPITRWRGTIVNYSFALVIFTVIGLNREAFLREPQVLVALLFIGASSNFVLGAVLEWTLRRIHQDRSTIVTSVLLGTIKNTSLTAATALALFSERVSVPAAVVSVTNVLYLVWMGIHWAKKDPQK